MIQKIRTIFRLKTQQFKTEKNGSVMIEFAVVIPILLLLMMGVIELSHVLSVHRKIVNTGGTVADLITQVETQTIDASGADLFHDIAENLIDPLPTSRFGFRVISLVPDDDDISRATAMVEDGNSDIIEKGNVTGCDPLDMNNHGTLPISRNVIAVVSCYRYTPIIGYVIGTIDINMRKVHFLRPRNVPAITLEN